MSRSIFVSRIGAWSGVIRWTAAILLVLGQSAQHAGSEAGQIPEAPKQDWTIHFNPNGNSYKLAKSEPEQGVYLGAYVLQDQTIGYSMDAFNKKTGRHHASFFKYVGYGKPFPAEWVAEVKEAGAFPHIAWEPNNGLELVKDDAYFRQFARQAKQSGVPIFLRFASEMNGTWTNYSGDPDKYKRVWRMVHRIFAEQAPNVAMVWTVLAVPERTIERFYPGDAFVDWVGINVYNVKYHDGNRSYKADHEDPLDLLNFVYNRFSRTKPIQLSEFGATHFNTTDGKQDTAFAVNRISRLYSHLKQDYPRVKAVYYFDVNNVAAENRERRINDYSITGEQELLNAYRVATGSEHFLSKIDQSRRPAGTPVRQRFTYRGHIFRENGIIYADEQFYSRFLHVEVKRDQAVIRKIWTGLQTGGQRRIYRTVTALPLKNTVEKAGYQVHLRGNNIYIQE